MTPKKETAPQETPTDSHQGKKAPDTVRKGRRNHATQVQRYLPIAEIRNDTVILKNGGLRAILSVEALNFNLKSETEQQGIIAGYQAFLNTLDFPVQVVVRSRKVNIDPYIKKIREIGHKQKNGLLKKQTLDYADFIEKIVDVADIMQKRFYMIVPLDDVAKKQSMLSKFFGWLKIDDTESKAIQRYKYFLEKHMHLRDRMTIVQSGLSNIGLSVKLLTTHELIELYFQTYNPSESQEQKLGTALNTKQFSF